MADNKLQMILNKIPLYGFQGTTLIDYPGVISSIIFTGSCNLSCPYCHNRDLVILNHDKMNPMPANYLLKEMEKRKKLIKGINITGGEPLLFEDGILELCDYIKNVMGFKVKVDTNGTRFETLKKLIDSGNVDYIAMDVKTIIDNYESVGIKTESDRKSISRSIELLKNSSIENEFRITITPTHLPMDRVKEYGELVKGGNKLFIQQFSPTNTLDESWEDIEPYSKEEVEKIALTLSQYIETEIRGLY